MLPCVSEREEHMKRTAGFGLRIVLALSVAAGAAWAVAAADAGTRTAAPVPVVTPVEADAEGAPKAWVLLLAGVGVIGWAALRRLGQR